jgi:hypothetical protein
LHELQCAVGMEPFMELSGPERPLLAAVPSYVELPLRSPVRVIGGGSCSSAKG